MWESTMNYQRGAHLSLSPPPFSLSLLPSLSPSFKLKETFWTYSSCGLIHRTRLHGPKELSQGKGSSSWRVLRFFLCVENWFSWHPLAFVECLVNSWGHQKKWELMPVLLELAILVSFVSVYCHFCCSILLTSCAIVQLQSQYVLVPFYV